MAAWLHTVGEALKQLPHARDMSINIDNTKWPRYAASVLGVSLLASAKNLPRKL